MKGRKPPRPFSLSHSQRVSVDCQEKHLNAKRWLWNVLIRTIHSWASMGGSSTQWMSFSNCWLYLHFFSSPRGAIQGKEPCEARDSGLDLFTRKGWPSNTTRGSALKGGVYIQNLPCCQLYWSFWCTRRKRELYSTLHLPLLVARKHLPRAGRSVQGDEYWLRLLSSFSNVTRSWLVALLMHCQLAGFALIFGGTFYYILPFTK
jgi:hypothetical protein